MAWTGTISPLYLFTGYDIWRIKPCPATDIVIWVPSLTTSVKFPATIATTKAQGQRVLSAATQERPQTLKR
jgi:hypothetical protein